MSLLSINQLSSLTGHSREHVKRSLSDLPFTEGAKGAHLYDATRVLTLRLNAHGQLLATEQESRRSLNEAKKRVLELQEQSLRKERIPLSVVQRINSRVLDTVAHILKSRRGKVLDEHTMKDLFHELSAAGDGVDGFVNPPASMPPTKPKSKPRRKK